MGVVLRRSMYRSWSDEESARKVLGGIMRVLNNAQKREDVIYFLDECEGLRKIEQLNTKEGELVLKMIEKIHSSKGCVVCCDKKIDFVFIPCWHACVCEECEEKIGETCPMCRQISSKQRIYLP
uniref:RING-type domain-containing protein n=1 Tax=Globodera rostochiensis TaxID=31243 RepID=A0A914HKT1_GLORO